MIYFLNLIFQKEQILLGKILHKRESKYQVKISFTHAKKYMELKQEIKRNQQGIFKNYKEFNFLISTHNITDIA